MIKTIFFSCLVAVACAGGPASYDIATATGDYNNIGYSQESTQKGYAGQNVVSSYSRQENSPYSSVHVSNSRVSNDLIANEHLSYAAPIATKQYAAAYTGPILTKAAYAAPAYSYSAPAPVVQKTVYAETETHAAGYAVHAAPVAAPVLKSYAAPVATPILKSYAAPAIAYGAPATPVISKTVYSAPTYQYSAPVLAKQVYSAPISSSYATHTLHPVISKTLYNAPVTTPVISKAIYNAPLAAPVLSATKYSTPVYSYASQPAPILTKTFAAPTYYAAHASPIIKAYAQPAPIIKSYAAPAPVYTKAAIATQYAAAAPIVHATFSGLGTSYAWQI